MPRKAAVIWLLDELENSGQSKNIADIYAVAQQIKATCVKLLRQLIKHGVQFDPENLLAFSREEPHWLLRDSLERFGYKLKRYCKCAKIWDHFIEYNGVGKTNAFSRRRKLPDVIVIVCPGYYCIDWAKRIIGMDREVWIVKRPDLEIPDLELLSHSISISPLSNNHMPAGAESFSQAYVLFDVENFVPVHDSAREIALLQTKEISSALRDFLAKRKMLIDQRQSMACLKKYCPLERDLSLVLAQFGIQVLPAFWLGQPAEKRIIYEARVFEERVFNQGRNSVRIPKVAVIMSGDGHVLPAVTAFQKMHIPVWAISWGKNANRILTDAADRFFDLETVLKEANVHCEEVKLVDVHKKMD